MKKGDIIQVTKDKYKKLEDMEAKKWLSKHCTHLDKPRQEIGLYELCLVMEEYHKHKLTKAPTGEKNPSKPL